MQRELLLHWTEFPLNCPGFGRGLFRGNSGGSVIRFISPAMFRKAIVIPALDEIGLWSEAAETLLCGTAIQESGLERVVQEGGGPALGPFQMEPTTHDDIWTNYLTGRPLALKVDGLMIQCLSEHDQLIGNWFYATAMCRVAYLRAPGDLPAADDLPALGAYWKAHYNTAKGAGTAEEWVSNYRSAYPC